MMPRFLTDDGQAFAAGWLCHLCIEGIVQIIKIIDTNNEILNQAWERCDGEEAKVLVLEKIETKITTNYDA